MRVTPYGCLVFLAAWFVLTLVLVYLFGIDLSEEPLPN